MKTFLKIHVLLIVSFLTFTLYAQEIQTDPVDMSNYKNLRDAYYQAFDAGNTKRAHYFATFYLNKAKKEDPNTLEHIHGHYFNYELSEFDNALLHLDSIITISRYLKKDPNYPEYAYFLKAGLYFDQVDLKNATDNYLLALEVAEKKNNDYMIALCKNSIGILKAEQIGQERDALNLLKESLQFYDALSDKSDYTLDYATLLFALSENHRRLKQLDSSTYYNTVGLTFSKEYLLEEMQPYFIYSEGINLFQTGFSKSAIVNLEKSIAGLDLLNTMIAHYYLSKSYEELGHIDKKMLHLKALDSLQEGKSIYLLELKMGMKDLLAYYEKLGDKDMQLRYHGILNTLVDIEFKNYKELLPTIDEKYDDKEIINENEVLSQVADSQKTSNQKLVTILVFLVVLIVSIFYYFNRRQKTIKKQFEVIMNAESSSLKDEISKKRNIDVPQETMDAVLRKLDDFETDEGYLQPNISSLELRRITATNNKYLVDILKHAKGKGIVNYINDLRVEYAMRKLKSDPEFMKYTIKGIATEVGFSNVKSFTKSFERVFKISTKNFIDELKKI